MGVVVTHSGHELRCSIQLPPSKSIALRYIIIQALRDGTVSDPVSGNDDTRLLTAALTSVEPDKYLGMSGAALRFAMGFYTIREKENVTLTGEDRLCNRTVKDLADALRFLGSGVSWLGKEGFPPVMISGKKITGGKINIKAEATSQFISSLLLIAPYFKKGLHIVPQGQVVSRSYILLTIYMMRHFGIDVEWNKTGIHVRKGRYLQVPFSVESDWSAAAFWYEMAALSEAPEISLLGLNRDSWQGDSMVTEIFEPLGVISEWKGNQLHLSRKIQPAASGFMPDLQDTPDLAPPLVAAMGGNKVMGRITGLSTLKIKESDRLTALAEELSKTGITVRAGVDYLEVSVRSGKQEVEETIKMKVYNDHRMAMALAPLALKGFAISLDQPEAVSKSYPEYWDHLKLAGFKINEAGV